MNRHQSLGSLIVGACVQVACSGSAGGGSGDGGRQCILSASDAPDSGMTGPCYAAGQAYATSCGGADAGVSTCTSPGNLCACEAAVDSAPCHTLFDTAREGSA